MKIPYGISNFESLREENYIYIDKTSFIEVLENINSKYLFFIRPRRFGKSLFLSVLEHYYDVNSKSKFNKLFGDLYIGKNPTLLKNSYLVLRLNFSGLNTENKEKLENSFRLSLVNDIVEFIFKYKNIFENAYELEKEINQIQDIKSIFKFITKKVQNSGKKLYLIIDEYDHFANDIIAMGDDKLYKDIIRATGFVRDFYETIKIGTESTIDRIFITGISPVMLDDLTSGFNIASNLTLDPKLNDMMGFTEEEVEKAIDKLGIEVTMPTTGKKLSTEELLMELNKNYNGYLFNIKAKNRVYNPGMTFYFFQQCIANKEYPDNLIDDNIKTDYGRLNRLTANQENKKILEEIIKNENVTASIATRFSFDTMYDREYFVSLLFYMGLLTIDRQEKTRLILKIPNYVIKTVFWEYILTKLKVEHKIRIDLEEIRLAIEEMAYEGRIEPYVKYISKNVLNTLSNRDLIKFDEKYIKLILIVYISDSNAYRIHSEREIEEGYIDIYLEKAPHMPDIKYEWLIELKYLKESERDKLEEVKKRGLEQLERYAKSKNLADRENLKKALLVFIGKKDYVIVEDF
ncbi:MAG: ATP-binding protein [Desulfotomaculum sp.]|nr:ATP-binding protein [Desulfotomaculum sp.]